MKFETSIFGLNSLVKFDGEKKQLNKSLSNGVYILLLFWTKKMKVPCVVLILEVYSIINKMVCLRTHYMAPFLRQV